MEPAFYLYHLFQNLDLPVFLGFRRWNRCGQIKFVKFTFDLFQNFRIFRIRVHRILIFVFFQGVQIPVPMGGFGLCGFQFINLGFLIGIGIQQNPFFLTISRLEERSWKIRCVRDNPGLGRLIHRQSYLHTIFIAGKECFKVLCLFKDVQTVLNNPHMVFGFCYGVAPPAWI